jgi:hypothetical protein
MFHLLKYINNVHNPTNNGVSGLWLSKLLKLPKAPLALGPMSQEYKK